MVYEKEKLIKFVVKLIEITQEGKLLWMAEPPRNAVIGESHYPTFTTATTYQGNYLRVRKFTSSVVLAERTSYFSNASSADFQQNTYLIFEIIDGQGNCLWTFPDITGLSDLYDAIRYQVSGVKNIIDSILGE